MNIADQTVGDIAAKDSRTLAVFREFGMDYCCGGHRTVAQQCESKQLDLAIITRRLEGIFAEPRQAGTPDFNDMNLENLVDYIEGKHHAYVRRMTPEILYLVAKVAGRHGDMYAYLRPLHTTFVELSEELDAHINKEEMILFPYVRLLGAATSFSTPPFHTISNPIRMMELKHDHAGELLHKMQELTGNYNLPDSACASFWQLFKLLQEFEADLLTHIHLENNILFPRAKRREAELQNLVTS